MPKHVANPPTAPHSAHKGAHKPAGDGDGAPRLDPVDLAYLRDPARPVLAHARDLAAGSVVPRHAHPRAQLLRAASGLLRIATEDVVWLVPPGFAVWIPGDVTHEVWIETDARMSNLYFDPSVAVRPTATCEVLFVSPLLRLVIERMLEDPGADPFRHLGAVARDEIARAGAAPLDLPAGNDPRLRRITRHLGRFPQDDRTLPELAAGAAASPRTIERLFRAETGLGFRQWRTRARLMQAVARLERGESSTRIAYSLGYRSVSAFVAAFRREFGRTPQAWFRDPAPD